MHKFGICGNIIFFFEIRPHYVVFGWARIHGDQAGLKLEIIFLLLLLSAGIKGVYFISNLQYICNGKQGCGGFISPRSLPSRLNRWSCQGPLVDINHTLAFSGYSKPLYPELFQGPHCRNGTRMTGVVGDGERV